ncbi:MAG: flagellar biosynthesis protein FlhF, partial [Chitinispirillaceae bacterium]|nr:flagellar biosynthesis protein FlhF [Chitinispirillaceae bacterium]
MRIKKFTAETMREALLKIKEELGEDAIILNTRRLSKKIFPIGGKEEIEVTAAVDETSKPLPAMPPINLKSTGVYSRPKSTVGEREKLEKEGEKIASPSVKGSQLDEKWNRLEVIELKENLKELRELIKGILQSGNTASAGGFSGGWAILYKKLIDAEVKPEIATELIKKIDSSNIMVSDAEAEKRFMDTITSFFPVTGPLRLKDKGPLIVVFIGPTGSGKTTTIAKLAAHCRIAKDKKVSIITADTYRIAAIEQIRVF